MKVVIRSEEELAEKFKQAIHILNNLRARTKFWGEHYGKPATDSKKYWEERADEFLKELEAEPTNSKDQIKIVNQ